LGIRTPRGKRAADICAAIISSISYLAFIGYAYSLPKLYGELMALHTAVLLAVVAAALCTSRPDSIVTSKNAGGVVFRRVIAPLLVLMPLLGFVSIRAQQVLGLKVEMGTALLVVLAVFLFAGITAHTAGVVNGLDLRRRRAEDSLIRAEKLAAAGRLSATIAHEINNPLECVMNLLYLARTSDSGTTNADYIRTAEDELRRAAEIAKRTLGFYRDDSEPVDIRLGVVAREVLDLFLPRITAAGIRVETDLQATGSVSVRPGEIRQIISNLLGNAIDAVELRNEPTITIVTREGSDAVQLAVRDNGCGIPSSLLQQVFEPFFTTKKDVGTGLGLYLSRELANKNGGSLRLQSSTETDNRGTIAYLTLPISSAKGQSIPGPERVRAHVQGENS
jgi:signal transduction histidine kinase